MSTRSLIGQTTGEEGEFKAIYSHSDGYPTWMGRRLWKMFHEGFNRDLPSMLDYIMEHSAGWSVLGERCYCHPKDFRGKDSLEWRKRKPEPLGDFRTQENLKETDCEWLYVFDIESRRMFARDLNHDGAEMIVELDGPEPDWTLIECGGPDENWARCRHYAWYHGLQPKTSNLSTQTYLGNRPLEFHDVIAFIIGGKRFKATDSGGNSNHFNRHGKTFPRDVWVSTVVAGNGRRLDLPVARITKDGYDPLPGVTWIYPSIERMKKETVFGA